jgi:hypothetical protein
MKNKHMEYFEQKILESARQYARIVFNGFYIENGVMTFISLGDKKSYEDMFLNQIKIHSKDYLSIMTAEEDKESKLLP